MTIDEVRPRNRRLLLTVDAVGGVWQYATDLARALVDHGFETILALIGPTPSEDQRSAARAIPGATLVETGLPLDWLAETPEMLSLGGRRLAELARHLSVDLIQINHPAFAADAAFPAPVIAVSHSCLATWWAAVESGPLPADFAWRAAAHGEGLRAAEIVVTPSRALADATRAAYALPATPTVVHNGRASCATSARPIADHAFTAGRLWDHGKDVATLDCAAARLGVPFHAAGATVGPQGASRDFHHLHLLGRIDEEALAGRLAERPVFASAALYEPFGLAVLEAAQAGCTLVLADNATFRELWDGAATFVAPGDDAGFAAAIEALIADPATRQRQGDSARARAADYTPARIAAAMAGLYDTLLATPASAQRAAA